jgi:hypothetical protein
MSDNRMTMLSFIITTCACIFYKITYLSNFNCKTIYISLLRRKTDLYLQKSESVHILLLLKLVDIMGRHVKIVFVNSVQNITVRTKFVSISFLDIFYLISQFVFKMLISEENSLLYFLTKF